MKSEQTGPLPHKPLILWGVDPEMKPITPPWGCLGGADICHGEGGGHGGD